AFDGEEDNNNGEHNTSNDDGELTSASQLLEASGSTVLMSSTTLDESNLTLNKSVEDANEEDLNTSNASRMTLISMGAHVPQTLNGKKPPLENFAVGMGELIYFENLPTSTGVFDKMRKVIKKIRRKIG